MLAADNSDIVGQSETLRRRELSEILRVDVDPLLIKRSPVTGKKGSARFQTDVGSRAWRTCESAHSVSQRDLDDGRSLLGSGRD